MAGSLTRREALERALDEAASRGPMSFKTYMELALYHPEGGYYTRPEMHVGTGGDFHTSPTLHPAFGTCLARQFAQLWELLGKPSELCLLELGAGSGQLADQVLQELSRLKGGWGSVRYAIAEQSGSLIDRQKAALKAWGDTVQWIHDLEELAPPGTWQGIVFSNELFDALPVHRVIGLSPSPQPSPRGGEGASSPRDSSREDLRSGSLRHHDRMITLTPAGRGKGEGVPFAEIGVMRGDNGRWRQIGMIPTTPRLAQTLAAEGIALVDGQQAEVNLEAQDLMDRLGSWLGRGFVVTIDYGDEACGVYAPHRMKGTIRGYYRQLLIQDPLAHPGEQDLTSDVDFTALMAAGERAGLKTLGIVPQGEFLLNLGIQELEKTAVKGIKSTLEADYAASGIRKLYKPEAMGESFLALVQSKRLMVSPQAIAGLGGTPWRLSRPQWLWSRRP